MSETTSQVTLRDVARVSGVSHQTVSRVINAHPNVAARTRDKVLSTIETLGYRRNSAARQLVTGKSNSVGIISYGVTYYGPAQMLSSIESALRLQGFGLVFASLSDITLADLEQAIHYVQEQSVDGVVMITPLEVDISDIRRLCQGTPFVLVDAPAGQGAPTVAIQQSSGAALAAQHLLALGHRRLAELTGPRHWHDAKLRHEGFSGVLAKAGLAPVLSLEGDWSAESGFRAVRTMLEADQAFTALFAANDQMALGALHALQASGLTVPREVSVVGFDDIPEAAYFTPALTTVRQDFAALGQSSVATLLSLLQGESLPKSKVIQPRLIERQSSAPL